MGFTGYRVELGHDTGKQRELWQSSHGVIKECVDTTDSEEFLESVRAESARVESARVESVRVQLARVQLVRVQLVRVQLVHVESVHGGQRHDFVNAKFV